MVLCLLIYIMNSTQNSQSPKMTLTTAVRIGFAGGFLFTISIMFFVTVSMLFTGYRIVKTDITLDALAVVQDPTQLNAVDDTDTDVDVDLPTKAPKAPVELTDTDHRLGPSNAPVTIVEYSDLECPFCKSFHPIMEAVVEQYNGKVSWVYRHFPLKGSHPNAVLRAQGAECVAEVAGNDAFWAYLSDLFEQDSHDTADALQDLAAEHDVDTVAFRECLDSEKYIELVDSQFEDGLRVGVSGTPTSILIAPDGQQITFSGAVPINGMMKLIDSVLEE